MLFEIDNLESLTIDQLVDVLDHLQVYYTDDCDEYFAVSMELALRMIGG